MNYCLGTEILAQGLLGLTSCPKGGNFLSHNPCPAEPGAKMASQAGAWELEEQDFGLDPPLRLLAAPASSRAAQVGPRPTVKIKCNPVDFFLVSKLCPEKM
jgi:hypothetical protein